MHAISRKAAVAGPKVRWLAAIAVLIPVVLSGAAASRAATTRKNATPLTIGAAVSLTGYSAVSDTGILQGMQLAAAQLNKHGGAGGHKIIIKTADVQSSAATAVTVANQLINGSHVGVLIGGLVSTATAAMSPIAASRQVPLMVGSALGTGDLTWTFSEAPPTSHLVGLQLLFAAKKLKVTKIGVLYSNTVYGQTYTQFAKDHAGSLGLTVVGTQAMDPTATDLTPQITNLLDAGAQAILDETFGGQQLIIAKNLVSLNQTVPLILNAESPPTASSTTNIYSHTFFIVLPVTVAVKSMLSKAQRKVSKSYAAAFASRYGSQANVQDGCRGWDMVHLVAAAVKSSGAVSGDKLRNALEKVKFQGCSSAYAYTKNDHSGQEKKPITQVIAHFTNGFAAAVYAPSK